MPLEGGGVAIYELTWTVKSALPKSLSTRRIYVVELLAFMIQLCCCYSLASAIAEQARCRPCSCDVCFLIWEIELYVNAADIQEPIRSVVLHDGFAIDLKIRTTSCKNARYPQAQDF